MAETPDATTADAQPATFRGAITLNLNHRRMRPFLMILTFITTFVTGAAFSFLQHTTTQPTCLRDLFGSLTTQIVYGNARILFEGLTFSLALISIMSAHEFGHYFACKYYKVEATLPYFIPAPPGPFTPFGTFGAVIRIKSPVKTKKALFDIGLAGPLAGFCLAVPIALAGLLTAQAAAPPSAGSYQYNVFDGSRHVCYPSCPLCRLAGKFWLANRARETMPSTG